MLKYPCHGCGKTIDFEGPQGALRGEVEGCGVVQNSTIVACSADCAQLAKDNYKAEKRALFDEWMKRVDELRLRRVPVTEVQKQGKHVLFSYEANLNWTPPHSPTTEELLRAGSEPAPKRFVPNEGWKMHPHTKMQIEYGHTLDPSTRHYSNGVVLCSEKFLVLHGLGHYEAE